MGRSAKPALPGSGATLPEAANGLSRIQHATALPVVSALRYTKSNGTSTKAEAPRSACQESFPSWPMRPTSAGSPDQRVGAQRVLHGGAERHNLGLHSTKGGSTRSRSEATGYQRADVRSLHLPALGGQSGPRRRCPAQPAMEKVPAPDAGYPREDLLASFRVAATSRRATPRPHGSTSLRSPSPCSSRRLPVVDRGRSGAWHDRRLTFRPLTTTPGELLVNRALQQGLGRAKVSPIARRRKPDVGGGRAPAQE